MAIPRAEPLHPAIAPALLHADPHAVTQQSSVPSSQESIEPRRLTRVDFTVEYREELLEDSRQETCLRRKRPEEECSHATPCQHRFQLAAVRGPSIERQPLSFSSCIRTSFSDINIFASSPQTRPPDAMRTETLMLMASDLLSRVAAPACFKLQSHSASFNQTMVSWLTDPDLQLPSGSIVGLCCSSLLGLQFQDETVGEQGLIVDFQRFLLATTLVQSGWHGDRQSTKLRDITAAAQISGCRLIKRLDRILTPQFLACCDRESCQVLFLLVLGTVLGVGYYSPTRMAEFSPSFLLNSLTPESQRSPTRWIAMKAQLCKMLAHHLIFIGSMLGIELDKGLEQRIIDTATMRWNKAELFVWGELQMKSNEQIPPDVFGLSGFSSKRKSDECGGSSRAGPLGGSKDPIWADLPNPLIPVPVLDQVPPPTVFPATVEPQQQQWSDNPQSWYAMFDQPDSTPKEAPPHEEPHRPITSSSRSLEPEFLVGRNAGQYGLSDRSMQDPNTGQSAFMPG
ncbi:uncharacterized protein CTHT_0074590 [Thermochaetoides thermophila DSM 1495]|uniref:Uncharacterized protein n=1 Tax=Chaetomium thermophilum (strain DSM 1495 / CBS 144.50 / IMI 039719) TaxID=759272 RepID=G0SI58_CHATD|nr:hypothetical protein CTHT_0074590 [Thermochaetoides thermophila DSM 1495]EGS17128.1 hypothetical protein CTHT_0074590 [Thermochaetoides thermophila DSM 1495]